MKSEHETRLRWEDYLEMSMVEGVKYTAGGAAITLGTFGGSLAAQNARGTEGFFSALESRGNVYQGFGGQAAAGGTADPQGDHHSARADDGHGRLPARRAPFGDRVETQGSPGHRPGRLRLGEHRLR